MSGLSSYPTKRLYPLTKIRPMSNLGHEEILQAVAVGYKPNTPAPRVLSKGKGEIAQAILDRAKELGIPTKSEPSLVAFLMELDLNAWVPPELYAAIAQVLAWAHEEDKKLEESKY